MLDTALLSKGAQKRVVESSSVSWTAELNDLARELSIASGKDINRNINFQHLPRCQFEYR